MFPSGDFGFQAAGAKVFLRLSGTIPLVCEEEFENISAFFHLNSWIYIFTSLTLKSTGRFPGETAGKSTCIGKRHAARR